MISMMQNERCRACHAYMVLVFMITGQMCSEKSYQIQYIIHQIDNQDLFDPLAD